MNKQPILKESLISLIWKLISTEKGSKYLLSLSQKYGGIFYKSIIGQTYCWITKKEIIEEVLINQAQYFVKPYELEIITPKGGIFATNDHEHWSEIHKPLASALHMDKVLKYSTNIISITNECITNLLSNKEEAVDLDSIVKSLTLTIIYNTLLQTDSDPEHEVSDAITHIFTQLDKQLLNPLVKLKIFRKRIFKPKRVQDATFSRILKAIYSDRISKEKQPEDIINLLLSIYKNHGHDREQKIYFFTQLSVLLTASDTIRSFLMHALLVLAKMPEIADKLYDSIKTIDVNDEKAAMGLLYCDYLQAFIKEVFRFYSVARTIIRTVSKDIEVSGVPLCKDTLLVIDLFSLHHDKDYWAEPLTFNPERFLVAGQQHDFLMPFGIGERMCPGRHFAVLEISIVLSLFIKAFSIETNVDVDNLKYKHGIVYTPKGPIYVKLKNRI